MSASSIVADMSNLTVEDKPTGVAQVDTSASGAPSTSAAAPTAPVAEPIPEFTFYVLYEKPAGEVPYIKVRRYLEGSRVGNEMLVHSYKHYYVIVAPTGSITGCAAECYVGKRDMTIYDPELAHHLFRPDADGSIPKSAREYVKIANNLYGFVFRNPFYFDDELSECTSVTLPNDPKDPQNISKYFEWWPVEGVRHKLMPFSNHTIHMFKRKRNIRNKTEPVVERRGVKKEVL